MSSPEEKAKRRAKYERERAAKLSPEEVARHDKGRAAAEAGQGRRGPGRPRKDGSPAQPRATSVAEAIDRVKAAPPAEAQTAKPAEVVEWRPPTAAEVAQVRFFMEMGNEPLVQLERDLEGMGIVGENAPPALAKKGEIPASEKELRMGSEVTAGAMLALTPSIMPYLSIIGFGFFTVGFIGSRLLIFWRIKRALDAANKAEAEEAERRAAMKSKLSPTAAPSNGAVTHAAPVGSA